MGWAWEISEVDKSLPTSYRSSETVGWHIRCSFKRPDTNTGEMGTGFGRWWFIEKDTTVNGIVKTMWAACKMIVEHELHEAFLYQGKRLFDPHAEVDDLIEKVSRN